ncbi:glycerol-3-phosphate dehydrogenase [Bacillus velezensis]|uniref:glycerol-3-phosphate dehydrogenase n=1 Tax=Bacillus TaxID=1386 RepID=UPI000446B615|nr:MULTISPECIES: glycerol-3-phosphate dehydrogenase [Bacillus amyloliquefaciens group]AXY37080.1 glycerol-3-phosphate dehydrogenase/oxidase [Bacillus velezensis]EYB37871.1 glycerol-3-phosphate dehydrogenase [Bacillus amyloliquefaciens EBL11]KOC21382.1 glycerol-3-phosphate dehydrogenase [Bacillus velezensis]KOC22861.1 glycerol-3-phosphate dehydrogenase [Bacillus velezensis]MBW8583664.1 glycerol-3-phosphate dehydrogenase [Bacillus amyloliquefaciens]
MMNHQFSSLERDHMLEDMTKKTYDLFIIGGGITGAGTALDAASRGMKVALSEMQDFAAGTSSRSTKLVHGGLRYLKQFEVKMVAEVGKERAIVYENGPHVTTPEWMLLPFHKGGTFGSFSTSIGLRVYDYLAGVKKSERRSMLSAKETLQKEPLVKKDGLKGGGYYVEYRTDDARLTIEVMKEAVKFGAEPVNYSKVKELLYEKGKVVGVLIEDLLSGKEYKVYAKKIVNATGPWVDELREKDHSKSGKHLQHTKGVHLVFDQSVFPLKQAVYFDTPDGRMVFAIPREGKTYVGTTDTVYKQKLEHPRMTVQDRDYVVSSINYMFPELNITADDIESSWAGLRPLIHEEGKDPSEISRKDEIWTSQSGLITIAGGKLTGYRKMAEHIVDLVRDRLKEEGGQDFGGCKTKTMPISGGHVGGSKNFESFVEAKTKDGLKIGLPQETAKQLAIRYGSNVENVFSRIEGLKDEAEKRQIPVHILAEAAYSIEEEMAATPADFFVRRTGRLFFDIKWVQTYKTAVIDYMSDRFQWNDETKEKHTEWLNTLLHDAVVPLEQ